VASIHKAIQTKKINKGTSVLNCTTDQMDLIGTYKESYSTGVEYTFFSEVHRTFSKIVYILVLKASL
jgi:hypothetical protein